MKLSEVLDKYQIKDSADYFKESFSRNIGLLSSDEQLKLKNARIAVPGLGGVGGTHLITMVRSGVGKFNISDFDVFEPVNVNRQYGASMNGFGRSKLEVMKEQALSINPFLEIEAFPEGVTPENIDSFLDGVDVVLDGLDFFNFDIRRLLFNTAREKGIYVVTAAPLGFSSAVLVFSPDKGMGFDEYFNIVKGMKPEEQYLAFAMGLAPRPTHVKYMDLSKVDLSSKKGPSLNVSCQICAGFAGTEALRIILEKSQVKPVPYFIQYDPFLRKLKKGKLYLGNRNPVQKLKTFVVKKILDQNRKRAIFQTMDIPEIPTIQPDVEKIPEKIFHYIIKAGIRAPSGDNAQPSRFRINENKLFLYNNPDADRSFFNVEQIASIISCGAAIENMRVAAQNIGLETRVEHLPDKNDPNLMAELMFEKAQSAESGSKLTLEHIWKRHTNRTFYQKRNVKPEILNDILTAISDRPDVNITFHTDRDELKRIAKIIYKADQIRTQNKSLHEHLNQMIRFTDQEAHTKRDGFPLKNLEAGFAGEIFLKATKPWPVMNVLNKIGISKMVALHSYQGIMNSSGVAMVSTAGLEKESFLKAGQTLESVWLEFTRMGLSVQPMTAITLFWLRWQLKGKKAFPSSQQNILASIWEEFSQLFSQHNLEMNGPVMLFRFGYGRPIKCRTLRQSVSELLIE